MQKTYTHPQILITINICNIKKYKIKIQLKIKKKK